jgi:hypothetical protein
MTQFSKKFVSLLESMRSDFPITERREKTSDGRNKERTTRRTASAEEGFKAGEEIFNIRSFVKALKLLFTQIMGERDKVSLAISTKADGSKYAGTISRKLDSLLSVTDNLINTAQTRFKEEGGKLEKGDEETITTWRDQYNKVKSDFIQTSTEWIKAVDKQTKERPVDADNAPIEKDITEASKFFEKAVSILRSKSSTFAALSVEKNKKQDDKKDDSSTTTELATTIKKGKTPTGKDAEIVIEVKKLIYNMFKSTDLIKEAYWKEVYKNYPNITAIFGPNTASLIKTVKGTMSNMSADNTSDINPLFYKTLKTAKVKESIDNNWGKIVSFESFMKSKINENEGEIVIDLSKVGKSIEKSKESSSSSSNKSKSKGSSGSKSDVPSEPATPFKTKEDGDKFREWVNKKYPDWAKENKLDASGSENNSYIRKAYSQYGSEYEKSTSAPTVTKIDGKQMNALLKQLKDKGAKVELQLTQSSGEPVILFYSGKVYGHIYNTKKVSYVNTEGGKKTWWGTYDPAKGMVSFDGGKAWKIEYVAKCTITERLSVSPEMSKKADEAQNLLIKMSDMIVAKFGDTGFWKEFKGSMNDDEDGAVAAFSKWYGNKIEGAYYNPAINRINQLPAGKLKENLLKNTSKKFNSFQFKSLINKLYGSSGTDTYRWSIYKADGKTKDYNVDTDF